MIEKPQCERQGCDALAAQGSWALQSEWPSVSGWPDFVTWPLLRAAERTADASRALEGALLFRADFPLFWGWRLELMTLPDTLFWRITLFWLIDLSQPSQCSQLSAPSYQSLPEHSTCRSKLFGLPQIWVQAEGAQVCLKTKPNHRHTQNFNITSQVSLVLHSYCRSYVEGN